MTTVLEPIIGLEIHVQLKTKTKMFCGCATHDSAVAPNTNVCPICLGHPGTLPVPNEAAVRAGTLMGLALKCEIAPFSKFDRKNYFYPDLPKGYQISQFDLPIAEHGKLAIRIPGGLFRDEAEIRITRAHLEEDAAKNIHGSDGKTYVDFNRAGTPLIEIVTEPDFHTPQEAKAFLQELRLIARYLGISDADMEKGHLRCDANVSLRERNEETNEIIGLELNPKTEIKNLNSFRHVERAIQHEIERQTELFKAGSPPAVSTTRGWDDAKGVTVEQRSKEEAADYRYFPEPDIPAMELASFAEDLRGEVPELPSAKRARFEDEYGLRGEDAKQFCEDIALANFAEHVFSELQAWLNALPELDGMEEELEKEKRRLGKLVAGWMLSKLGGLLAERSIDVRTMKITPENFAEFITLIATGKLNSTAGLTVLNKMLDDGDDPTHIMEDQKLGRVEDEDVIATAVDAVIAANPEEVRRYLDGEEKLIKFFIGKVMKETEGTADPKLAENILTVKLNKPTT